ncbi:MAG: nucleotidyltransferase family protein [Steroidobacteraceae bacterium]
MVLAAGRGERMRPLTDHTPKPLIPVQGKPLLFWHLEALARAGFREVVINLAWLGAQIRAAVGDGSRFGLQVSFSDEGDTALETGGGIHHALRWLGDRPFLVINADTFTDLHFERLVLEEGALAHLVLVPNPDHHPRGDFALNEAGFVNLEGHQRHTYAGYGIYDPQLFADCVPGRFPLLPLLRKAIAAGRLRGELYRGLWSDVGTVQRLQALELKLG